MLPHCTRVPTHERGAFIEREPVVVVKDDHHTLRHGEMREGAVPFDITGVRLGCNILKERERAVPQAPPPYAETSTHTYGVQPGTPTAFFAQRAPGPKRGFERVLNGVLDIARVTKKPSREAGKPNGLPGRGRRSTPIARPPVHDHRRWRPTRGACPLCAHDGPIS